MEAEKDLPCLVCQRPSSDALHYQMVGPGHEVFKYRDHTYIPFPTDVDHCGNCGHEIHGDKCPFMFNSFFGCKCEQCILVEALPIIVPATDGGPVYPLNNHSSNIGLTKREWYKGKIIEGMNASPELMQALTATGPADSEAFRNGSVFERMAINAGKQADAMIAEDIAFRKNREPKDAF